MHQLKNSIVLFLSLSFFGGMNLPAYADLEKMESAVNINHEPEFTNHGLAIQFKKDMTDIDRTKVQDVYGKTPLFFL